MAKKQAKPAHSSTLISAWREARVANYANTRSPDALARMVVELEDASGVTPEFEIDELWPEAVANMRRR